MAIAPPDPRVVPAAPPAAGAARSWRAAAQLREAAGEHRLVEPGGPRAVLHVAAILAAWAGLVAVGSWVSSLLVWIPVWICIAFLIVGLAGVGHDCVHATFVRSRRLNVLAGHAVMSAIAVPFGTYRQFHLLHHADTAGEHDPEGAPADFTSRLQYLAYHALLGAGFLATIWWATLASAVGRPPQWARTGHSRQMLRRAWIPALPVLATLVAASATSELFRHVWLYPWLFVLTPVLPFVLLSEHYAGRGADGILANTYTIRSNALTRFAIFNINFHTAHHLLPRVPSRHLRELDGLVGEAAAPPGHRLPRLPPQRADRTALAVAPVVNDGDGGCMHPPRRHGRSLDVRTWRPSRSPARTRVVRVRSAATRESREGEQHTAQSRTLETHRVLVRALAGRGEHAAAPAEPNGHARPLRLLHPGIAWAYLGTTVALALTFGMGLLDQAVYPIMLVGTMVSIVVGVRRNRPTTLWHWLLFIVADLLWAVAGIVRQSVHATGVLTSQRSLLPDVFADPRLPRRRRRAHRACSAPGAPGAATATPGSTGRWSRCRRLLIAWVFALRPAVADRSAWLPAQVAVATTHRCRRCSCHDRLRGRVRVRRRSPSHQMVFIGTVCLLAGDIAFAMEEVGSLSVGRVFELPFLLASALFGAAALHPSMRHLSSPISRRRGRLTNGRVAMIAAALLLPAVVAVGAPGGRARRRSGSSASTCAPSRSPRRCGCCSPCASRRTRRSGSCTRRRTTS